MEKITISNRLRLMKKIGLRFDNFVQRIRCEWDHSQIASGGRVGTLPKRVHT
jgi:hypothetical protein